MNFNSAIIISFTACIILISCKKEKEENESEENYIWTGKVVDQVTNLPIENASVSLGYQAFCEIQSKLAPRGPIALSGSDGRFKLIVSKEVYTSSIKGGCFYIYGWKEGYAKSSLSSFFQSGHFGIQSPPDEGEVGEIKLFHYGKLALHVSNDTLNNTIDQIVIYVSDNSFFNISQPGFGQKCQGKNFDTVFFYNNLCANTTYFIRVSELSNLPKPLLIDKGVLIKPDTTTLFSISY